MPRAVRPHANAKRRRASASRAHPCPDSSGERCHAASRAPPRQRQAPTASASRAHPCPESRGE
eukprot:689786-Prymnesium_polylepis.1